MVTLRVPPFGIIDLAMVTLVEPAVPLGPLTVKLSVAFSGLKNYVGYGAVGSNVEGVAI